MDTFIPPTRQGERKRDAPVKNRLNLIFQTCPKPRVAERRAVDWTPVAAAQARRSGDESAIIMPADTKEEAV